MSHTALVEFPCNAGKGEELVEFLSKALVDTRAFKGNESIEVYTEADNPDVVLLWEKWESADDYAAYLAWRMETGLMDALAPFMDTANVRIANLSAQDA